MRIVNLGLALVFAGAAAVLVGLAAPSSSSRPRALSAKLASWQSVGGCGAGASSGTSGGVKWIGRNVRGGLFHVECQVNYVEMPYGYNFVGTTLVSHDLTDRWNLGVSVPYLYKYMNNPFATGVDLANKGPGDVNVLLTRKLGATGTLNATLMVGAPTGTSDVAYKMQVLQQDRQLGLGKPTASFVLDKVFDNLWGPVVVGGTLNWRGGENELSSYRAPSASTYAYASYLLGSFAPAVGVSLMGFKGLDKDAGEPQAMPLVTASANVSIEWAFDTMALLLGASIPYELGVRSPTVDSHNQLGAWVVALGVAFAAF